LQVWSQILPCTYKRKEYQKRLAHILQGFYWCFNLRLYILDNGWLEGDSNWIIAMSTVGTLQNKTPPTKWSKIPVYCVLLDGPDGKILYDTGCHPDAMKGYWPPNLTSIFPYYYNDHQLLSKQLALADTKPEEIKTVILSHLHLDHAGNTRLFKNAEVYVHKNDFEYAKRLVTSSANPVDHGAYVKSDLDIPTYRLHLVEGDCKLTKGVELISLPGHTPGLLGLMVHLKEGTFIFPADALYTQENYGPPVKMSGIVYDTVAFRASIEKIRVLQVKYQAKVMFSHDMPFFNTLKLAPQSYS
jgi:N-acyl homoserine lactone hydrolase